MIVLSLFDGISGARLACERAGIKVDKYYASEIDKYAIEVSKKNFPDIIQLGDITKWKEWKIEQPDLIVAGFPCQPYSIAGKRKGLEDKRGGDIVDAMFDVIKKFKTKYFLLENVKGLLSIDKGNTFKEIIKTLEDIGYNVNWKIINSSLVSAQNRERVFISNIDFGLPEDKGILLKDIVFSDAQDPTVCMHNLYGGFGETKHRTFIDKSPTIRTAAGGGHIPSLLLSEKALEYMDREVKGGRTHWDFQHHSDVSKPKSAAVVANFFKGVPYNVLKDWNCIRYFDPIEVERLQTYPDNYTEGISKTQRYKALGNSFTVDVIAHILNSIKESENG